MADEVILQYVKSIDERTARMETAFSTQFQQHLTDDKKTHENIDGRIKSLENSRLMSRAGIAALTIGGGTGAAKAGLIDKIISFWGGS